MAVSSELCADASSHFFHEELGSNVIN